MRGAGLIVAVLIALLQPAPAHALSGKLQTFAPADSTQNWKTTHPRVVFAFGPVGKSLVHRYSRYARGGFLRALRERSPGAEVVILEKGRGADVVRELRNPDTVGLVFITHTYETNMGTAVLLGADGNPLPNELFSAATPALRFAAFLGCHGPAALKQYQVDYEFGRLAGQQIFYSTSDQYLSTGLLGQLDGVKHALKGIARDLKRFDFSAGADPEAPAGEITLQFKDVVAAGFEPRYVLVNGRIAGTIGSGPEDSNAGTEYRELRIPLQASALAPGRKCQRVAIRSAELSEGALADDYLLRSVSVSGMGLSVSKTFDTPLHFGDQAAPGPEIREKPVPHGRTRKERIEYLNTLVEWAKSAEWLDRTPGVWEKSPLQGRFFSGCL